MHFFVWEILKYVRDVVVKMAATVYTRTARCLLGRRCARHIVFATCCFHSLCAVSPCFVQAFYLILKISNDERVSKMYLKGYGCIIMVFEAGVGLWSVLKLGFQWRGIIRLVERGNNGFPMVMNIILRHGVISYSMSENDRCPIMYPYWLIASCNKGIYIG